MTVTSLYHTPETKTISYVSYTSIFKNWKDLKGFNGLYVTHCSSLQRKSLSKGANHVMPENDVILISRSYIKQFQWPYKQNVKCMHTGIVLAKSCY